MVALQGKRSWGKTDRRASNVHAGGRSPGEIGIVAQGLFVSGLRERGEEGHCPVLQHPVLRPGPRAPGALAAPGSAGRHRPARASAVDGVPGPLGHGDPAGCAIAPRGRTRRPAAPPRGLTPARTRGARCGLATAAPALAPNENGARMLARPAGGRRAHALSGFLHVLAPGGLTGRLTRHLGPTRMLPYNRLTPAWLMISKPCDTRLPM